MPLLSFIHPLFVKYANNKIIPLLMRINRPKPVIILSQIWTLRQTSSYNLFSAVWENFQFDQLKR